MPAISLHLQQPPLFLHCLSGYGDIMFYCLINENRRAFWTFLFSARTDFTRRKRSKSAHFCFDFARLQEQGLPEKPYISSLFEVCLGFLQELHLPSLSLGIRQNKNIVHYIRRSYLGFIIQMAVNIRCCADIAVTEPLLNLLHRYIVCKK